MFTTGGPHDVVALSVGARDGIDNGTVFSTWRVGSNATDRVEYGLDRTEDTIPTGSKVRLPDAFAGHVMVFRTFGKMSSGLVMQSVKSTRIGSELKNHDAPYRVRIAGYSARRAPTFFPYCLKAQIRMA